MTQHPTPLGTFEQLAPELRRQIYEECIALGVLHLLPVNSTFYSEYLESVGYLRFHIDPSKHPSTVDVFTRNGSRYATIDAASPHLHFDTNPIRTMPIGRYRMLELKIDAPDPEDPGQAIRLIKQVSALVTSLAPCCVPCTTSGVLMEDSDCLFPLQMRMPQPASQLRLPRHLRVTFNGIENGSWGYTQNLCNRPATGGALTDDTDTRFDECSRWFDGNYAQFIYILRLLQQIRGVSTIIDSSKWSNPDDRLLWLKNFIYTLSSCESRFGLDSHRDMVTPYPHEAQWWRREGIMFCDCHILQLTLATRERCEDLLDDLPGPSANLLRQERFWKWCSAFERQHCREIQAICRRPTPDSVYYVYSPVDPQPKFCFNCTMEEAEMKILPLFDWEDCGKDFNSRFWFRLACDLSDPAGVERKSRNEPWILNECIENPHVFAENCVDGGRSVRVDELVYEPHYLAEVIYKMPALVEGASDCAICKAEAERNCRVAAQETLQGKLEALSAPSGLRIQPSHNNPGVEEPNHV